MALRGAVGRRYAEAVFEIAVRDGTFEKWDKDLSAIAGVLSDDRLVAYLESRKASLKDKKQVLSQLLEGKVSPLALNLALLMLEKGRTSVFEQLRRAFTEMMNDHLGIAVANVATAVSLDEKQQRLVQDRLGKLTGKKIILQTRLDPSIIGGLVARIGDKLIDASVATSLAHLKEDLA